MNPKGNPQYLVAPWKPGVSPNPGGKPLAVRNMLTAKFLKELAADFEEHGKKAIALCREKEPGTYLKVIAALLPKQIEAAQPLGELSDHELLAMVEFLRAQLSQLSPEQLLALRAQMPGPGAAQMPVANGDEPA